MNVKTSSTMSSLEIAKLTGKTHDNVLKDIRRILDEVEIDHVQFNAIFLDAYKREQPCFSLPRIECDLVVSGYSAPYRFAIIKRWHELEGYQLKPKTRLELAREQLVLIEEIDRQEKLLELQAPKVEIANALIADAKLLSISEALAHYSINRKAGFELLKLSKWIYKKEQYDNVKTSIWLPTELARKNEWLILKQRVDQQNILRPQALVTALGLTEMRKLFY